METLPDKVRPLDYSNPLQERRRPAVLLWLVAVVSLFVALISGDSVLDEFRDRERTQAYIQYTVSQDWRRHNDPTYVPPPFTGRKFVYESPFELKAFYASVLFGAVGGFAIRSALRRHRPPGHAG
ncbi:MAG TPA: hypothetical protein VH518_16960 [Tepidisphaeraceae bacterium]|jgi:hypothetical protein